MRCTSTAPRIGMSQAITVCMTFWRFSSAGLRRTRMVTQPVYPMARAKHSDATAAKGVIWRSLRLARRTDHAGADTVRAAGVGGAKSRSQRTAQGLADEVDNPDNWTC